MGRVTTHTSGHFDRPLRTRTGGLVLAVEVGEGRSGEAAPGSPDADPPGGHVETSCGVDVVSAAEHYESSRGQVEACLDDVVEVAAVIVGLVCEEMDSNCHGGVDVCADSQTAFSDSEPVQYCLRSPHIAEVGVGVLVQDVDLEVVREKFKVCRHGGIVAAA
ncbi:hypothetical protein ACFWAR_00075 [Streptomyces sp. NPDC059917]|uniref:hypothetical protein n=1 Tax=Streptomyces sp. NPDC059917 TaxID=3347002 RepID=UPI00365EFF76